MSRAARLLNTSVDVQRATRTPDGGGGWETAWVSVGSFRARLSQPYARERYQADSTQAKLDRVVYFDPSADVKRGDRIHAGPIMYDVVATFQPSEPGTYLRADCTELQLQ